MVFLILIAVGLARHTAAAAAADQNAGEQVDFIRFWRCPGINPAEALHQVKIMFLDDRLMGTLIVLPAKRTGVNLLSC